MKKKIFGIICVIVICFACFCLGFWANNKFKNKSPKGLSTLVLSPKITPTIPPIIIAPSRIIVDL